jgi:ABC-2 type transport system ATP-binding protein
MAMIDVRDLTRTFTTKRGDVEAVKGVSLTVEAGEIVGFLGPNGAGKTTTLRMLTTLLAPTSGDATVAGVELRADPVGVRRRVGYVAQGGGTDPNCYVMEELLTQAALYRVDPEVGRRRAEELCRQLDLSGLERRQCKTLSGGQRRRLDIALGMVHSPALIFLDEPSTGLDPQSRSNLWTHIKRLRDEQKTTVFLTTHYLDEADALCDRVLIIDDGRIVAEGTPDELKRRVSGDVVTVDTSTPSEQAVGALREITAIREINQTENTLRLTVEDGDQHLAEIMRVLDRAGVGIASIQLARPTLDDVFLTLTGRSLRDEPA